MNVVDLKEWPIPAANPIWTIRGARIKRTKKRVSLQQSNLSLKAQAEKPNGSFRKRNLLP